MRDSDPPSRDESFSRLELLLGEAALARLARARVLVCGVGGVGSWAAEMLVRSGIMHLTIVDPDRIKASNLNRQLPALHSTIGRLKGEVLRLRLLDISPEAEVDFLPLHLTEENIPGLLAGEPWDYVVDAIDERAPKLALIRRALGLAIPVVSSMGAANRLLPESVRTADIAETSGCPLARLIRKELRRTGVRTGLKVVFSPELPVRLENGACCAGRKEGPGERRPLGTIAYLPAMFGLHCASQVVRDLLKTLPPAVRRGDDHPPAEPARA